MNDKSRARALARHDPVEAAAQEIRDEDRLVPAECVGGLLAVLAHREAGDGALQGVGPGGCARGAGARVGCGTRPAVAEAQVDRAFAAGVVAGLDEVDVRRDVATNHRQVAVVVDDVEVAGALEDRARDALRDLRPAVGQEDAELVLLPAAALEVEAGNEGAVEADVALRGISRRLQPHQGDGVAALEERVAEAHRLPREAAEPGPRDVFADEEDSHERSAAGRWSRRTTKTRLAAA